MVSLFALTPMSSALAPVHLLQSYMMMMILVMLFMLVPDNDDFNYNDDYDINRR